LVDIQVQLSKIGLGGIDSTPIWDSRGGTYSCSETWDKLRVRIPEVVWWKLVWFYQAIPKHSFLLWLACRDTIVTKHKMFSWGYIGDVNCLFCHGCMEDRDHLFFICSFSRRVWRVVMAVCLIENPPICWDEVLQWGLAVFHGKTIKAYLGRLCIGVVVYHFWRQRNDFQHGNIPRTEEALVAQILWEVRARVLAKGKIKGLSKHMSLVYRWNLQSLL